MGIKIISKEAKPMKTFSKCSSALSGAARVLKQIS